MNLFDLDDFSNYRSSNYVSCTVQKNKLICHKVHYKFFTSLRKETTRTSSKFATAKKNVYATATTYFDEYFFSCDYWKT